MNTARPNATRLPCIPEVLISANPKIKIYPGIRYIGGNNFVAPCRVRKKMHIKGRFFFALRNGATVGKAVFGKPDKEVTARTVRELHARLVAGEGVANPAQWSGAEAACH